MEIFINAHYVLQNFGGDLTYDDPLPENTINYCLEDIYSNRLKELVDTYEVIIPEDNIKTYEDHICIDELVNDKKLVCIGNAQTGRLYTNDTTLFEVKLRALGDLYYENLY